MPFVQDEFQQFIVMGEITCAPYTKGIGGSMIYIGGTTFNIFSRRKKP